MKNIDTRSQSSTYSTSPEKYDRNSQLSDFGNTVGLKAGELETNPMAQTVNCPDMQLKNSVAPKSFNQKAENDNHIEDAKILCDWPRTSGSPGLHSQSTAPMEGHSLDVNSLGSSNYRESIHLADWPSVEGLEPAGKWVQCALMEDQSNSENKDLRASDPRHASSAKAEVGTIELLIMKDTNNSQTESQSNVKIPPDEFLDGQETRKLPSSAKFFILILCLSLVVSLYFAIFGSPVSFRNFFYSLTEERKIELANELRLKYMFPRGSRATFLPDSNEKLSILAGISYSPVGSIEPSCEFTTEDAIRDIVLLSSITLKIKTYGTQCDQMDHILQAIQILNLDMKISMGVWISDNSSRNSLQIQKARKILMRPDLGSVESVLIGHDAIYRGDSNETSIIAHIKEMKSFATKQKINVLVGTSEFPSSVSQNLVDSCDIIGFPIQPFLNGVSSSNAAQWSLSYFLALKNQFHNKNTKFFISEIGWPYEGGRFKRAEASPVTQQEFMRSWVEDKAKSIKDDWYIYEAFNEPWKTRYNVQPDSWEAEWGIFDDQKKPRDVFSLVP